MTAISDRDLVERWMGMRDPHAFREITSRHATMVYAVSRRVLGNSADAEDITQECFLKLAEGHMRAPVSVAGWLYTVAVRLALNKIRADRRRTEREAHYLDDTSQPTDTQWDELRIKVDEAISELPEALRHCVVRHFLEGQSQEAVAEEMGVLRWTVSRRINKGIDRIRQTLRRKGVSVTAAALAVSLGTNVAEAVPPTLVASLGNLALGGMCVAVKDAATTVVIGSGTQTAMLLSGGILTMKKAIVIGLAVLAAVAFVWHAAPKEELQPDEATPMVAAPDQLPVLASREPAVNPPATDAILAPPSATPATQQQAEPSVGPAPEIVSKRFESPADYATVHGWVRGSDEVGVPGAEVTVTALGITPPEQADEAEKKRYREAYEKLSVNEDHHFTALADNDGRFLVEGIPYQGVALVQAAAQGYVGDPTPVLLETATNKEVTLHLRPGVSLVGRVLTEQGAPIPYAKISLMGLAFGQGAVRSWSSPALEGATSDREGRFTVWVDDYGIGSLAVVTSDYGTEYFNDVPIEPDGFVELRLNSKASLLKGRISWNDGTPAAGCSVRLRGSVAQVGSYDGAGGASSWSSAKGHSFSAITDSSGAYEITGLNTVETFEAEVLGADGALLAGCQGLGRLTKGENTRDFRIEPPIAVTGVVRGTVSRRPLPSVKVSCTKLGASVPGISTAQTTFTNTEGEFEFQLLSGTGHYEFLPKYQRAGGDYTGPEQEYRVELELYVGQEQQVELSLPEPCSRAFVVMDVNGQAVPDVQVGQTETWGGVTVCGYSADARTDAEGRIRLTGLTPGATSQMSFSKEGFAEANSLAIAGEPGESLPEETVVMYPHSGIAARLVDESGQAITNTPIKVTVYFDNDRVTELEAATDTSGNISIPQGVPATHAVVEIALARPDEGSSESLTFVSNDILFQAGKTIDFGTVTMRGG